MKKITSFIFFIFLLFLFNSFITDSYAAEKIPYTVLIYMNGSDLESASDSNAATEDLKEMMNIQSNQNIKIIVETGGTLKWKTPNISNTKNQRWEVSSNSLKLVDDNVENKSMGTSTTLSDFISWSVRSYPSDKYSLIFWNHGGGAVNGFGYDELHLDDPSLTLDEINTALETAYKITQKKFDFIGFDACLMSSIEMAFSLKDFANYMIASEELEPEHGWNYTPIFDVINKYPKIQGLEIGKIICDSFKSQSVASSTNDNITISLTDLNNINELITSIDNIIYKLDANVSSNTEFNEILKARSKSEDYGNSSSEHSDMADLGDLARNLLKKYPIEAQNLTNSLKNTVKYVIKSSSTPNSTGLSIYFPYKDKKKFNTNFNIYKNIPFSLKYKNFIDKYIKKILMDNTPVQLDNDKPDLSQNDDIDNQLGNITSNNFLEIHVNRTDLNQINNVYSVLGNYCKDDPNKLIYLGMDNDVIINNKTGQIKDTFTGKWYTLNGEFVSMFLIAHYDDYYEYSIPAKLNNKNVDIIVFFNNDNPNGKFLGAWEGVNSISGMAYKEISQIFPGDEIIPLYYYNNISTSEEGYIENKKIIIKDSLYLGYENLTTGNYLYGFYISDLSQNGIFSKFININVPNNNNISTNTNSNSDYTFINDSISPHSNIQNKDVITVYLNGNKMDFDINPIIENGRTLVPARKILESLGLTVEWMGGTKTIVGYSPNYKYDLILQINKLEGYSNGKLIKLDSPAIIKKNRTLVPLRFVAESLGANVSWNQTQKTIYINTFKKLR